MWGFAARDAFGLRVIGPNENYGSSSLASCRVGLSKKEDSFWPLLIHVFMWVNAKTMLPLRTLWNSTLNTATYSLGPMAALVLTTAHVFIRSQSSGFRF